MSHTTVPQAQDQKTNPDLTKALNLIRSLPEADLKVLKAKVSPKREPKVTIPRTPAGGLAESLDFDSILEASMEKDDDSWTPYPGRYYFSKIGNCFRKEWYKENATPCDHGEDERTCETCRFDAGKAAPGNATERWMEKLMDTVYTKGRGGAIMNDLRISVAVPTETGPIHLVGKTDMLVMGDNMVIKEFMELKTAVFWKSNKTEFGKQHGKSAPLFMAGIDEPEKPNGLANLNNAIQLAVGVQILRDAGATVEIASLIYMSRERYRDYLRIMFSDAEIKFLYDWAIEWLKTHHANVQSKTPPAPEFAMGYECRNCSFSDRCKTDGGKREIIPSVRGINARLAEANQNA